jgi:hypothetical protein
VDLKNGFVLCSRKLLLVGDLSFKMKRPKRRLRSRRNTALESAACSAHDGLRLPSESYERNRIETNRKSAIRS